MIKTNIILDVNNFFFFLYIYAFPYLNITGKLESNHAP